jgi:hypothetical protein
MTDKRIKGLKITKKEVSQTINLEKEFGVSFRGRTDLKQAIGQALIDKMVERTQSGVDVNGSSFKGYSPSYVKSDEFKAFGKSKGDINLTLTGDMLNAITPQGESAETIKIKQTGRTNILKQFNHNTGDTVKKRKNFGVTSREIKEVKEDFKDAIKELKNKQKSKISKKGKELLSLLGDVKKSDASDLFADLFGDEL